MSPTTPPPDSTPAGGHGTPDPQAAPHRAALVTGASSGIGLAIARRLAREGYSIALVGRRAAPLQEAAAELCAAGAKAVAVAGDVSDEADAARVVEAACAACGPIELLVNNAGATEVGSVVEFSSAAWDRLFAVNTRAVFLMSRAVLPRMLAAQRGHIINIASVAAKTGFAGWAAYCASKAAVAGFSRALLEEVRGQGVRVSVLYPGGVATPLWDSFANDFNRERMLRPEDVAEAVCWAASQPAQVLVEDLSLGYLLGNQ
jgi:3-oxoacyl-[acyl-carrier protein] reductase